MTTCWRYSSFIAEAAATRTSRSWDLTGPGRVQVFKFHDKQTAKLVLSAVAWALWVCESGGPIGRVYSGLCWDRSPSLTPGRMGSVPKACQYPARVANRLCPSRASSWEEPGAAADPDRNRDRDPLGPCPAAHPPRYHSGPAARPSLLLARGPGDQQNILCKTPQRKSVVRGSSRALSEAANFR